MPALVKYEAACKALAAARAVDEVLAVRDQAERMRLYARQAKDRGMLADASEIHLRAERKLGAMLTEAKSAGQIAEGRPKKNCAEQVQFSRVKLADAGIDRKLSARAQKCASISERAFKGMVKNMRERIVSGASIIDKTVSTEDKQERRAQREVELGSKQQLLPQKRFGVIVADPEWRFEPWSRKSGMDRAADNHYPTSCTEVIADRDVPSIAADDCVLFLWATAPMLPQALLVMGAWGFDYKTHLIWYKQRIGTGYWFRNCHELLLLGTRGNVPAPAMGKQSNSFLALDAAGHSAKPEYVLEIIEGYFPTLPKIELNRRGPARPGWTAWGNEAGAA